METAPTYIVTPSLDLSDNKDATGELHPVFVGILTMHADRQREAAKRAQEDFLAGVYRDAQAARFSDGNGADHAV